MHFFLVPYVICVLGFEEENQQKGRIYVLLSMEEFHVSLLEEKVLVRSSSFYIQNVFFPNANFEKGAVGGHHVSHLRSMQI